MNLPLLPMILLATTVPLSAAEFSSGPGQVSLVELYTSEGCSSCPPAESWLKKLQDHPNLWRDFIPLAFHVDYWDYLGWKDSLASPAFTKRQRALAASNRSASVYTPGFFINGREWRGFFSRQSLPQPSSPRTGLLEASYNADNGKVQIRFHPENTLSAAPRAHAALLGSGISHQIGAGENKGIQLEHPFTVLDWHSIPMSLPENGLWLAELALLPSHSMPEDARSALAVWIESGDDAHPIQATGGWLSP